MMEVTVVVKINTWPYVEGFGAAQFIEIVEVPVFGSEPCTSPRWDESSA